MKPTICNNTEVKEKLLFNIESNYTLVKNSNNLPIQARVEYADKIDIKCIDLLSEQLVPGGVCVILFKNKQYLELYREHMFGYFLSGNLYITNYIKKISGYFALYIRRLHRRNVDVKPSIDNVTVSVQFYESISITRETLNKIDLYTSNLIHLIILDNECNNETTSEIKKYLEKWKNKKRFRKLEYIRVDKNNGVVPARNIIIDNCKTPYLIRLFGDILVGEKWVEKFIYAMNFNNSFYTIGATEYIQCQKGPYFQNKHLLLDKLGFDNFVQVYNQDIENKKIIYTGLDDTTHLGIQPCDHAQIVDMRLHDIVGNYDPLFFPHFYSVTDFIFRAYLKGIVSANTELVFVMHNPPEDGCKDISNNKYCKQSGRIFFSKYDRTINHFNLFQKLKAKFVGNQHNSFQILQEETLPSSYKIVDKHPINVKYRKIQYI